MTGWRFAQTLELVVAAGIAALLTIVYVVYAGRVLGPAEYSDFSAALSLIQLFAVALTPLTPTMARVAARKSARGDVAGVVGLRSAVMRRLAAACLSGAAIALIVSRPLSQWMNFRSPLPFTLAIVTALLFALLSADRGVLQGLMRFREYNVNLLIESIVRLGGALLIIQAFRGSASAALVSYAAAIIVAATLIMVRFSRQWRSVKGSAVDWAEVWELLLPMLALMTAAALFQNVDMLAVKRWFAPADAGYYGAAVAVSRGFGVLFVPLYVLSGPSLTDAYEKGMPVIGAGLRVVLLYPALCAVPLAVLAIWPAPVMTSLFGTAFIGAARLVALLGGISILLHTGLLLTQIFVTLNDFRFLRLYAVAAVLLLAGLTLFHRDMTEIFATLYGAQIILLSGLVLLLSRARRAGAHA